MRTRLAAILLSALVGIDASAGTFTLPAAGLAFDAPAEFTELSKVEIARKYPSTHAPGFVVGNAARTTTIAYDLKPQPLPADRLPEVKTEIEAVMERMVPGLQWKARQLIELRGRRWIYLELSSRAVDTDIHNIILITSLKGRMLALNFNSTRSEFPRMEKALRRAIESIVIASTEKV